MDTRGNAKDVSAGEEVERESEAEKESTGWLEQDKNCQRGQEGNGRKSAPASLVCKE